MRRNATETDRHGNFEKRLKETLGSELQPEMITPQTAGQEELTSYTEQWPLVKQMDQTNMRSGGKRVRDGQLQADRDNE